MRDRGGMCIWCPLPAARRAWCCTSIRWQRPSPRRGRCCTSVRRPSNCSTARSLALAEKSLEYRHYLDFVVGQPESLLLVEFSGETDEESRRRQWPNAAAIGSRLPGLTPRARRAGARALCDHVWACRKASLPLLLGVPGGAQAGDVRRRHGGRSEPAAASSSPRFREIIARAGPSARFTATRRSAACTFARCSTPADRDDQAPIASDFARGVRPGAGVPRCDERRAWRRPGPQLSERAIVRAADSTRRSSEFKAAFDPAGDLNPGKVVDGPRPDREPPARPELPAAGDAPRRWISAAKAGLARAAEMCNGSGVCRKAADRHDVPLVHGHGRRRAQHPRPGQRPAAWCCPADCWPAEFTGRKLFDTFDLCLQCKGCKAECPSNVDVAKLKAEFLQPLSCRARRCRSACG